MEPLSATIALNTTAAASPLGAQAPLAQKMSGSGATRKPTPDRAKVRSGPWKLYEDQLLAEAVERVGPHNWTKVAACVPGRSGKSCRLRWCNQLNPQVNKAKFSPWEQAVVHHAFTRFGGKWALIAQLLPGRTDNSVKNFWNCAAKKNPANPVSPNNSYLKSGKALELLLEDGPPKETMESYTAAKKAASDSARRRSDDDDCLTLDTGGQGLSGYGPPGDYGGEIGTSSAKSSRSGQFLPTVFGDEDSPAMYPQRAANDRYVSQAVPPTWVESSELGSAADMLCGRCPTGPASTSAPSQLRNPPRDPAQYRWQEPAGGDGMAYFYQDVANMIGPRQGFPDPGLSQGRDSAYQGSMMPPAYQGPNDYHRYNGNPYAQPYYAQHSDARFGQYGSGWA